MALTLVLLLRQLPEQALRDSHSHGRSFEAPIVQCLDGIAARTVPRATTPSCHLFDTPAGRSRAQRAGARSGPPLPGGMPRHAAGRVEPAFDREPSAAAPPVPVGGAGKRGWEARPGGGAGSHVVLQELLADKHRENGGAERSGRRRR